MKLAYEAADATLTQGVADNTAAITAEANRAKGVEAELAADIAAMNNAETGTLATMKSELQGEITAEADRAKAEEADIRADFAAADSALDAAKQGKSSAYSIGAADGNWSAFSAMPGYSASGTHTLSLVGGVPTWVPVVDAD